MSFDLAIPSFVAGLLMFFAPCTLPLVPAYLGFISGVSIKDLNANGVGKTLRGRILLNGFMFAFGFSLVFIFAGGAFGYAGSFFLRYRDILSRAGGILVILFGLYFLNLFKLPIFNFLKRDYHFSLTGSLKPGNPTSSFLFGTTFAFGWSPCIGPVLGTVLFLASTSATAANGAFLLFIFSLGFTLPFLFLAAAVGHATRYLKPFQKYLGAFSVIAGIFLILIGVLLFTDRFNIWTAYIYRVFDFINYDSLLNYL